MVKYLHTTRLLKPWFIIQAKKLQKELEIGNSILYVFLNIVNKKEKMAYRCLNVPDIVREREKHNEQIKLSSAFQRDFNNFCILLEERLIAHGYCFFTFKDDLLLTTKIGNSSWNAIEKKHFELFKEDLEHDGLEVSYCKDGVRISLPRMYYHE